MAEVFINYRTEDGDDEAAELITSNLSERFGKEHVFKASRSIQPGDLYPKALIDAARKSAVLLAVMGPNWGFAPQLRDEADWVRREILAAQASGASVVPVLKGRKTDRLARSILPPELRWLADVHSLRLDTHESTADLNRIGDFLADLVPTLKAADRSAHGAIAAGSTSNSVSHVTGTVLQGRDFTGDVMSVNDANAPVQLGHGNVQLNFLRARLRAYQKLRQPIDQLRWLSDRFVAPQGFDDTCSAIKGQGTVVLAGSPGSGRTAAAQMLVYRSRSGQGQLHELEPHEPDEDSSFHIDPDYIGRGDGMWIDLSDADLRLWARVQRELPTLHDRVLEHHARLVIIQPHGAELRPDFRLLRWRMDSPPPLEVFWKHLSAEGLADREDRPTPQFLDEPRSMADVRHFVDDVLDAKDQSDSEGDLANWITAAEKPTSPREAQVSKALTELASARDRALLLSIAMLHGAHADVVDRAANGLLASLPGESGIALERQPFGERLRKVGAEIDAARHVRFTQSGHEAAVRMFFWLHFPELHDTIANWVRHSLDSADLSDDDRAHLARGFAGQCLDQRYQSRWAPLVEHLTAQSSSQSRELAAAAILQVGLSEEASSRTFRRQVYDWSRASGTSGSLTTVLVIACQQIAETHPDQALVRLHHLARRNSRRTDVRDALASVAHRDRWLMRLLLSRLTGGHSDMTQEADARIFLDIADVAFLTACPPVGQPLIAQDGVTQQLARGWALAFTWLPMQEWASRAHGWLRRAAEDDASRLELVDVLVEGARLTAAVLPALYRLAHRADFRDAIAGLLLIRISAVQGVELP